MPIRNNILLAFFVAAAAAASASAGPSYPQASVNACIYALQYQVIGSQGNVTGTAWLDNGDNLLFFADGTQMQAAISVKGQPPVAYAVPGIGWDAGKKPDAIAAIERAAEQKAWLTFSLAPSTSSPYQPVAYVARAFDQTKPCR